MNNGMNEAARILSALGMARKAGVLVIGQDRVLGALRSGLLVVAAGDCAKNVLRKLTASSWSSKSVCYILDGVTRDDIAGAIGVANAQVVALPLRSGFANRLTGFLQSRGRCLNEQQNESV